MAETPSMIKRAAAFLHRQIARSVWLSRSYLASCRLIADKLPQLRRKQLLNSLAAVQWPQSALAPQDVIVGTNTRIRMHPHNDEFDFASILGGRLGYESEVFRFLDTQMSQYDAVLEIGANVGVFTLYFGTQLAARGGHVHAFEPSSLAFSRLLSNLQANGLSNVFLFNAAVGGKTGFAQFHEPAGHLTNGSLVPGFAAQFSDSVRSVPVLVIDAARLLSLVEKSQRVLVKIDAEGYEAPLLHALASLIAAKRPDILLEVLPEFETAIGDAIAFSAPRYELNAITTDGLQRRDNLTARSGRDCFLSPKILSNSSAG